ncbi:TonB-dependent receptor plug domain-containing protein, partial [Oleiphilus sp. HI0043]|uniref:TonB-dependent receptor n=1 Tax=Oleiphilus sp. HI0043 TaxID=1822233 RepID=UPI0018D4130E
MLGKHNEVLVQTSRPKLTDVDPSSNTGLVTVIKKEDFSSDAVSVADIVERQVGVQVRDLGGFGSFSSVSVRGSSSKQVNVYLDGVLLNGSYQGAVDLSQFLLGAVEQVEIYRGNVPIYLEQAGIGGAINIKTSGGARKAGGLLSSSLGSEGIKRAAASYKGSLDTLNYLFSAEHFSADNDYTVINTNDTPDYYADDYDQNKNNNDVVHTSLLASFNEQVNEAYRFSLTTQYSNKEQGVPEIQNLADNDATYDSEFFSMQANIEQHLRRGIVFNYSLYGLYKETIFR